MKYHLTILGCFMMTATTVWAQQPVDKSRLSFFIFNTDDGSQTALAQDDKSITLITEAIHVQTGQRVELLLIQRKINPNDKDIYELLYELNPVITDLGKLAAGNMVWPKLVLNNRTLGSNQSITVHLDDQLKKRIVSNITKLSDIEKNDSAKLARRLQPAVLLRMNRCIAKLLQISIAIQSQTHILSPDRLSDLLAETELLINQTINDTSTNPIHRDLTTDEANIMTWARYFSEEKGGDDIPKSGKYAVRISLKKTNNALITSGYRIYYCAPGLEPHGVRPIDIINGTITCHLYPANWSFWAKKTPVSNPYPPDSEKIFVDISADDANVVNLTLNHE